ncbi:unnamed protein product [Diamesa serratosioi]
MKKLEVFVVLTVILSVESRRRFIKQMKFKDDVDELIETAGYCGEIHEVPTKDGYLLKVHRILPKKEAKEPKKPVFLMHGLFSTAAEYVLTGPEVSLAYYLVDNGYDVWMGNSRGSRHCMKHKTLTPETKEFWNFSWHEIGFYDLPAMIDYMLKISNKPAAFYVGHSQGTTSLMVLLSTRPEYNQKIIQGHLMAPAVFMKNVPHPTVRMLANENTQIMINRMKMFRTDPFLKNAEVLGDFFCTDKSTNTALMCQNIVFALAGRNKGNIIMDTEIFAVYLRHVPIVINFMHFHHFFQMLKSGKFRKFDYGEDLNLRIYNSSSPPDYQLSNVDVPLYIYHAEEDTISVTKDVEILKTKLPNIREYQVVNNYNHMDFNYGKNSRTVVYTDILKSFNNEGMPEKNVSSTMYDEE